MAISMGNQLSPFSIAMLNYQSVYKLENMDEHGKLRWILYADTFTKISVSQKTIEVDGGTFRYSKPSGT
jgi:hypothetical protein